MYINTDNKVMGRPTDESQIVELTDYSIDSRTPDALI
jgi:hypothetical protein